MFDDKPEPDAVDQRRPAQVDEPAEDDLTEDDLTDDELPDRIGDGVADLEADPADVVDQRRVAPVPTDEDDDW